MRPSKYLYPLLLASLTGCIFSTNEKVAGGAQDFPNTVSLGTAASTHISEHTEWDQFSVIPSSLPTFAEADSLVVPAETLSAKPKAAAKTTGAAAVIFDTTWFDFSDTATLKVVRRIHQQETPFKIIGDTITYKYDDKAKDSVLGNELMLESKGALVVKISEKRQAYHYENTDSAGAFDRAIFTDRLPAFIPAGFKCHLLVLLPGPDRSFEAKADNRPAYYAFARLKTIDGAAPDTLEAFDVTDVDGDGALWGAGDSGVVDFRQKTPNPPGRILVASITQKMRAILFKDEGKTYPISFRESRVEESGKQVVFSVHGTRGGADSTFAPGDTAWVSVHTLFPAEARMVEKTARYKVLLAGEPKKYTDNKLLRFSLEASWHKGDSIASTHFTFTPDNAVASKETAITGSLELSADLTNGHFVDAIGTFAADKVIDVVLIDKDKAGKVKRFRIKWSAFGVPLFQSRLD